VRALLSAFGIEKKGGNGADRGKGGNQGKPDARRSDGNRIDRVDANRNVDPFGPPVARVGAQPGAPGGRGPGGPAGKGRGANPFPAGQGRPGGQARSGGGGGGGGGAGGRPRQPDPLQTTFGFGSGTGGGRRGGQGPRGSEHGLPRRGRRG
jgi:23S rRNA pseudouridine2605 synthase